MKRFGQGNVYFWIWTKVFLVLALCAYGDITAVEKLPVETLRENEQLVNPDFVLDADGAMTGWWGWEKGFEPAPGEGRNGGNAVKCVQTVNMEQHGIAQTVVLQQPAPRPLIAGGWSRSEEVDGTPDGGYSLYLDLEYMDGEHLWAQYAAFSTGTHDWEYREFLIEPKKAIRTATVYGLFRGHHGVVWFADFSLVELPALEGGHFFEGVAVAGRKQPPASDVEPEAAVHTLRTEPLDLRLTDAGSQLLMNEISLGEGGPLVFVRDAARDSAFLSPESWNWRQENGRWTLSGGIEALEVDITLEIDIQAGLAFSGTITDLTGDDRSLTAYLAFPVSADGWTWHEDMRRGTAASGGVYLNALTTRAGATGMRSRYPLAAITRGEQGLALAVSIEEPRHHRLGYDTWTGMLYAAFDVGLSPAVVKSPQSATFSAWLYAFDGRQGFRGALAGYYPLFPETFTKRVPREGLWMAFTDIETVAGWEDFGFAFHEGPANVRWNTSQDILNFVYTEPMTTWLPLPEEVPRAYDAVIKYVEQLARGENETTAQIASKTLLSAARHADGRMILSMEDAPWCNGVVFALNAAAIPTSTEHPMNQQQFVLDTVAAAIETHEQDGGRIDGAYIDSYEFWANSLDFDRQHFAGATLPLVFDTATRRPAMLTVFATFEIHRTLARNMRAQDRYILINGALAQYDLSGALTDVLGTETNWFPNGQWEPLSDAELCFRRSMSYQRPYCFLMNTNYDLLTLELTERYMQRALFYGMFPGFFSENAHSNTYFGPSRYYEPARPLFKKYIPLIQKIATAGWEPVTHASTDHPHLYVERYGNNLDAGLFLTVMNDANETITGELHLDAALTSNTDATFSIADLISGMELPVDRSREQAAIALTLHPYQVLLLKLSPR